MANGNIAYDRDVCTIGLNLSWLKPNGELPICIAQPTLVDSAAVSQDKSRPDSLALANAILIDDAGQPQLLRWFNGAKGILLFPEYAFGSTDFTVLNQMIRAYPEPLIVIAGFGAVRGSDLIDLTDECQPTWPQGRDNIIENSCYNAAWCWIHCGPNDTNCYIFLKNFFEQRLELAGLEGVTEGNHILKVETNDLVLYPLICADLICNQPNSPRDRIMRSLPVTAAGQPDANKKVLVTALLYTPQSYHELWRTVINEVVSLHNQNAILFTVNQLAPKPQLDVQNDMWRCLTGGFINKAIMPRSPNPPLPRLRYISTDHASGLILRQPCVGVACGSIRWVNRPDQGLNVWRPNVRWKFENGGLEELGCCDEFHELKRYIQRRKAVICGCYDKSGSNYICSGLDQVSNETIENNLTPRLWTKLLTGADEVNSNLGIDEMDTVSVHLDRALAVFAVVQHLTAAKPLAGGNFNGQLKWGDDIEILVWKSPIYDWRKMQQILKDLVLKYPFGQQLIVLGGGCMGHDRKVEEIKPGRFADFTTRKRAGEITNSRTRHVVWKPFGEIENVMTNPQTDQDQKRDEILQYLGN